MNSEPVYYVVPVGEAWVVRAVGGIARHFGTLKEALACAEQSASRSRIRVLTRSDTAPSSTRLAAIAKAEEAPPVALQAKTAS